MHDFSSQQFGLLNSAYMFGSVLGATVIIVRKNKMKLIKLLNMTSILYILIGVFGHLFSGANVELFLIVFIIQLLMGATVSMVNIPLITSLQLIIPNKMQVRFFYNDICFRITYTFGRSNFRFFSRPL